MDVVFLPKKKTHRTVQVLNTNFWVALCLGKRDIDVEVVSPGDRLGDLVTVYTLGGGPRNSGNFLRNLRFFNLISVYLGFKYFFNFHPENWGRFLF